MNYISFLKYLYTKKEYRNKIKVFFININLKYIKIFIKNIIFLNIKYNLMNYIKIIYIKYYHKI